MVHDSRVQSLKTRFSNRPKRSKIDDSEIEYGLLSCTVFRTALPSSVSVVVYSNVEVEGVWGQGVGGSYKAANTSDPTTRPSKQ